MRYRAEMKVICDEGDELDRDKIEYMPAEPSTAMAAESSVKEFPFTAIAGQEEMKRALLLNLINPYIGGVLIQGERGTGKSTAVRSLARLMGEQLSKACPFGCDPETPYRWCPECRTRAIGVEKRPMKVIDLPISASLDRLVGSMDLETALLEGKKRFEPGILAAANRNILYVDEVNLLEDHIVDALLDASARGENTVEREGISYTHPSRFVLVGTMNPEEGDLRPQLLDRFALVVNVRGEVDPSIRTEIMERKLAFDADPVAFGKRYEQEQQRLKQKILSARRLLGEVIYSGSQLNQIAGFAATLEVEGHRADLSMLKTAMTLAALDGRGRVIDKDLYDAAGFALPHRVKRDPFGEPIHDLDLLRTEWFG